MPVIKRSRAYQTQSKYESVALNFEILTDLPRVNSAMRTEKIFPKLRSFLKSITRCPCLAEKVLLNITWNCCACQAFVGPLDIEDLTVDFIRSYVSLFIKCMILKKPANKWTLVTVKYKLMADW